MENLWRWKRFLACVSPLLEKGVSMSSIVPIIVMCSYCSTWTLNGDKVGVWMLMGQSGKLYVITRLQLGIVLTPSKSSSAVWGRVCWHALAVGRSALRFSGWWRRLRPWSLLAVEAGWQAGTCLRGSPEHLQHRRPRTSPTELPRHSVEAQHFPSFSGGPAFGASGWEPKHRDGLPELYCPIPPHELLHGTTLRGRDFYFPGCDSLCPHAPCSCCFQW